MGWPVAMPVAVRALHRWRRPGHQVDQAPWSRPLQSRYQAAHAGWNGALVLSCSMHIVSLPLSSLAHAERTRHGETRDSAGDHIACPGVRQNTRPRQSRTVLTGASACRSGPLSPSGRPQILHPTAGSRLSKDDVCIPTVLSFAVEMGPRPERTGIYTLGQGPPPSFSPTNTMSSSNEPSQINGKLHQYVSRTRSFLVSDPLQA